MTIKKVRTIGPRCGHKQKQQGAGIRSSVILIFLFDYFDTQHDFIKQGDKNIIEKILSGIVKMTRTDNKITLVNIKVLMGTCKKLSKNQLDSLSDIARDFFILFNHLEISSKYVIL